MVPHSLRRSARLQASRSEFLVECWAEVPAVRLPRRTGNTLVSTVARLLATRYLAQVDPNLELPSEIGAALVANARPTEACIQLAREFASYRSDWAGQIDPSASS